MKVYRGIGLFEQGFGPDSLQWELGPVPKSWAKAHTLPFDSGCILVGELDPTEPHLVFKGDGKTLRTDDPSADFSVGGYLFFSNRADKVTTLSDDVDPVIGYNEVVCTPAIRGVIVTKKADDKKMAFAYALAREAGVEVTNLDEGINDLLTASECGDLEFERVTTRMDRPRCLGMRPDATVEETAAEYIREYLMWIGAASSDASARIKEEYL